MIQPPNNMAVTDNKKLKTILDHLKISFLLFSLEYTLLDTNKSFLKMTGAKREKIIGLDMRKIITQEDFEKVEQSGKALMEGQKYFQYELFAYSSEKKRKIPCLFHASLNRDNNGNPISVNVLLMDLVEQKEIQRELEKEKKC